MLCICWASTTEVAGEAVDWRRHALVAGHDDVHQIERFNVLQVRGLYDGDLALETQGVWLFKCLQPFFIHQVCVQGTAHVVKQLLVGSLHLFLRTVVCRLRAFLRALSRTLAGLLFCFLGHLLLFRLAFEPHGVVGQLLFENARVLDHLHCLHQVRVVVQDFHCAGLGSYRRKLGLLTFEQAFSVLVDLGLFEELGGEVKQARPRPLE